MLEFDVDAVYLSRFPEQVVGGSLHRELWSPADELDEFNDNIVGAIRVVDRFGGTR